MIGKQTLVCCRQFMSKVQFTRHFFSSSEHALIVANHTAWLNLHGPPCHAPGCCLCFDSLFLTLFLSVCFSYLFFFFYQNPQLNLFLHHRDNIPLALRQLRSLAPWSKTRLSQVMNKTSLTTSTTQKQLKSSSRSNPATRCPHTCAMRNSTTKPSAERSLHHCSFKSKKNQQAEDKLITLLKTVCCQLNPCLSLSCKNGETRA